MEALAAGQSGAETLRGESSQYDGTSVEEENDDGDEEVGYD